MAYYPQNATGLNYITYPAGPTVGSATVVTASGSANVKGSYAQISASIGFTCNAIYLDCYGGNSQNDEYKLDFATGAGGAETVVIPDITLTLANGDPTEKGSRRFPLAIASGTRVSARVACTTGSRNLRCALTIMAAGGVAGISTFIVGGPTAIDPGGSANTKGSYAQLFASTSAVLQWLSIGMATAALSTIGTSWYADVATGAGGAEVVLIPDINAVIGVSNGAIHHCFHEMLTYIAASTRIAVRASSDNTSAGTRGFDATLIGGTAPSESSGGGAFSAAYVG